MFTTSLLDLLQQHPPGATAIVQGNNVITTGTLLDESQRLAAGLQSLGLQAGDTVVLAALPDAGFIRIVYAAMCCGLRLAVIDPEMGRDNYREKLRQLQPRWAFVDARLLFLQEHPWLRRLYFAWSKKGMYFPAGSGVQVIATGPPIPLRQPHTRLQRLFNRPPSPEQQPAQLPDDTEFLITYTSGTTSTPKGVVHSLGALTASIGAIARLFEGSQNRRLAAHLPYFALIALQAGMEAHLWNHRWSAARKLRFIEKHGITTLFGPPCDYLPLVQWCERKSRQLPACLQHLSFGSAPVHRAFLERLIAVLPPHVRLDCLYGMTENLLVARIDGREKAQLPTLAGDILGYPAPGVELRLAADGEILVRSPQTYTRYLHLDSRDAWHATGDLGCFDAAGRLVLTGRKKDMIIRRNFNLYPGLYEPTVNRIPGVVECAFVGVYDPEKHDETVALFVETQRPITATALRRALEAGEFSIDREALPDVILFTELPRRGRQSKVDKAALRQRLLSEKTNRRT